MSDLPPRDHNEPTLEEMLKENAKELLADVTEWLESLPRVPAVIESEDILGKVGKMVTTLKGYAKKAGDARVAAKQPHLDAGRTIDRFYGNITDRIADAVRTLEARQSVYLRKVEAEKRRIAQEEADKAAEEAAQRLAEAERLQDQGKFDEADTALKEAAAAETIATEQATVSEAKTADLVRAHTTAGVTVSGKSEWGAELVDRTKLLAEGMTIIGPYISDDTLLKAAKAAVKAGVRAIPGVKIVETLKALNR